MATARITIQVLMFLTAWGVTQQINNEIDARQPWKISLAEDTQNNEWLTRDVAADGTGFDAQWHAGLKAPT